MRFAKMPNATSATARSGYVAAKSALMFPPSEKPNTAARSDSAASITARTSSIRSSSVGSEDSATGSDSPVPRLSNRISLEKLARRRKNRS